MLDFFRKLSGPISLHLELTEACPEKCRHCYNFVRDDSYKPRSISIEDIDIFLDDFKANGGFHVILTGGEPLLVMDNLEYAIKGVLSREMSLSLNSNLMLATPDKMKRLKEAGVEHILTTLFSHDPKTHDFIASRPGAYAEIIKGIEITQDAGIRVSVNMIVTTVNDKDVYKTGELLHKMGFEKFIVNRMIPSTLNSDSLKEEFLVKEDVARVFIDDLLRLKNDFGMTISTCRAIPHCFLGDLSEHFAFTAQGCPGGKKQILIGVDGLARACVHEAEDYGNVKEIGVKGVWDNMEKWRRKDKLSKDCQSCSMVNVCEGGCRQVAEVVTGDWTAKDNLCKGPIKDASKFNFGLDADVLEKIKPETFVVNPDLEFRHEKDFYLVRILGAKCVLIDEKFAQYLISCQEKNETFTIEDFPGQDLSELGLYLIYDMVRPVNSDIKFDTLLDHYKK